MRTNLIRRGKILFALCACFALALTAAVGIGFTKPETAYAEATAAAKTKLTTPISAESADIDKMDEYGYAYYHGAHDTYEAGTLVLNGLNMEIAIDNSNWTAISFENASTLYLAEGSTNKIRILSSQSGSYIYAIYAYESLKIKGSGSLEIEFVETTRQNNLGYIYRAISAGNDITFEHTGSVTVTVEKIDVTTTQSNGLSQFNVCESFNAGVFYKSGDLFLNAGPHYCKAGEYVAGEAADYIMFCTPKGNVTLQMTPETGGSIGWNRIDDQYLYSIYFFKGKTAPSGVNTSGVQLLGGYSPESLTQADTIDALNGKESAKVWYPTHTHTFEYEITKQPTETEMGTAEGYCADGDGASDTLTLPVLTDTTVYSKVFHEATSQADAYDRYTYSKDGVTLTFDVVHANTRLHRYVYEVTTIPTATATGTATGTCADGDGATTTLTLPVLTDAVYTKVEHAATHEKDAYDTYTYLRDGITLTFDVVKEGTKVHNYVYAVTTKPTATTTGLATGTCAADGATTPLTLPVLTDAVYTKVEHAATHEKDAYDTYTYLRDGITLTFDVVKEGTKVHNYVYAVTTKPTTTATGLATGTCAADGATATLTLPVLTDAVYKKVEHAATHEKDAYDTYTYASGGITLTFDIEYAGTKVHNYVYAVTTKPTTTATGLATGTCAADDATATLTLPVLTDAVYTKVEHAATTEKDAYDTYTYASGGITLTFDVVKEGTKLPSGGGTGDNNNGGGDNTGLSAGAIAGITVGSVVGVLLVSYILGFFLFFNKGKITGRFFEIIYKPMSKLFGK